MAERILMGEYKALVKEKWVNIELNEDNILDWTVALIVVNESSAFDGGYFKAKMTFPTNYPFEPPTFQFIRPLFHPNIYPDGNLCISILHKPGEDEMSGELASERWTPVQRVESVLISVLSLLDDPEVSSPANVEASVMYRKSPDQYKERVKVDVSLSKSDIPEGFVMPTHESLHGKEITKPVEDDADFWADSDVEEDEDEDEEMFGGSDSDQGMAEYDEDDDDDDDDEDEDGLEEEESDTDAERDEEQDKLHKKGQE